MNPGKLRHRIAILKPPTESDAYGELTGPWTEVVSRWAAKEHKASRAFYAAQKMNSEMTDLFVIRYTEGVKNFMRLSFRGAEYDIVGAYDPDGLRRELHILCKLVE